MKNNQLKILEISLAGVASWVEGQHANQKVAGSIPGQGTCLGCGPGPWLGHVQEATDGCFSPSLSPSRPFSLKINKIF